jgi:hypothetical protein
MGAHAAETCAGVLPVLELHAPGTAYANCCRQTHAARSVLTALPRMA